MKKTLSVLAVLGLVSVGVQSAQAFTWSNLNPATWWNSSCPKCEKKKDDCGCHKKCNPCETGYAAPCEKKIQPCEPCQKERKICDPCDRMQQMNK